MDWAPACLTASHSSSFTSLPALSWWLRRPEVEEAGQWRAAATVEEEGDSGEEAERQWRRRSSGGGGGRGGEAASNGFLAAAEEAEWRRWRPSNSEGAPRHGGYEGGGPHDGERRTGGRDEEQTRGGGLGRRGEKIERRWRRKKMTGQPCWRAIKWQKNKKLSISNGKKLNTILRGVFG
uniref:Uncharacterized protein n=1 Tax=Oryza glumipatula TaxID=40148 RepID=A0A0D9Z4X8_9ORYZ